MHFESRPISKHADTTVYLRSFLPRCSHTEAAARGDSKMVLDSAYFG